MRQQLTVTVDENVLDALRRAAKRDGVPEDELVDEALRRWFGLLGNAVLDEPAEPRAIGGDAPDDDAGMALAVPEVLGRSSFRRYSALDQATEFIGAVAGAADEVDDPSAVGPVSRDPDDDYLVALARDAGR